MELHADYREEQVKQEEEAERAEGTTADPSSERIGLRFAFPIQVGHRHDHCSKEADQDDPCGNLVG